MLNIYTDREDFDLGIEDFGLLDGKDINVYILDENMKALSLMEAFRACRRNPLRTYYYIPKTESNFSKYAVESISRGTVNVFYDLDELREALSGEMEAWRFYSVPECISKSAMNFKIMINRDTSTSLSIAVTAALRKSSCYTVGAALLELFQSRGALQGTEFENCRKKVLETSEEARRADEEFKRSGSQFLSVLVARGKDITSVKTTEEYDEMALHVMFQPFEPNGKDMEYRGKIISQLMKEKR